MYREFHDYLMTCDQCQKFSPLPKYKTSLRTSISSLLDVFSIDFADPPPTMEKRNLYILVAVEHLTVWPITSTTKDATADPAIKFIARDIMH